MPDLTNKIELLKLQLDRLNDYNTAYHGFGKSMSFSGSYRNWIRQSLASARRVWREIERDALKGVK